MGMDGIFERILNEMNDGFGCPRISTATYFLCAQKVRKKAPTPMASVFLLQTLQTFYRVIRVLSSCPIYPREVFKPAILANAAGVILMHIIRAVIRTRLKMSYC
jgi:hypothetical protein